MMIQMLYGLGMLLFSAGTAFAEGFGGPTMFESLGMKGSQVRGADAMIHLRFGVFENKKSS